MQPPIGKFLMHVSDKVLGQRHVHSCHSSWALGGSGRELQADGKPRRLLKFEHHDCMELCSFSFAKDRRALRLTEKGAHQGSSGWSHEVSLHELRRMDE